MRRCVRREGYENLDAFVDRINIFAPQNTFPDSPIFPSLSDKPPTIVDYTLYSLRRLVVYAPHNGIFYKIKNWENDQSPSSPFESKTFSESKTYADYMKLRYDLIIERIDKPGLAVTKRIENFVDISKWVTRVPKMKSKKSSNKSMLIPELAQIIPIPYTILRTAMFIPRIVWEVERQLIAVQFFRNRFSNLNDILPPLKSMVTALTGTTAGTSYDYERMEILGDSLLKLFTTIDIYWTYNQYGEGRLSKIRQELISNFNLYHVHIMILI
jgi:dsRNA-specific ribonuclease